MNHISINLCTIFKIYNSPLFIIRFYIPKHLDKSGLVLADVLAVSAFDVILIDHGVLHGGVNLGVAE